MEKTIFEKILLAWSRLGTRFHLYSSLLLTAAGTLLIMFLLELGGLLVLLGIVYFALVLTFEVPQKIYGSVEVAKEVFEEVSINWNPFLMFTVFIGLCLLFAVLQQLYVFLKDGIWNWYTLSDFDIFNHEITTEWKGLNKIANWLLHELYLIVLLSVTFFISLFWVDDML